MIDFSEVERSCFIRVDLSNVVFSHKAQNEIQEIIDISKSNRIEELGLPITAIFLYALFRYYRHVKSKIERHSLLAKMICDFLEFFEKNIADDKLTMTHSHPYVLLILEALSSEMDFECVHCTTYSYFVKVKMYIIDLEPLDYLFSCNTNIFFAYASLAQVVDGSENNLEKGLIRFKDKVSGLIRTNADKIYYCQSLITGSSLQEATSLLETVVEQNGDYSLSVVIWSKEFWGDKTTFLGGILCEELIRSSLDYVVFPTNLYARYLLVNTYESLGQVEQYRNNLKELDVLLQRYFEYVGHYHSYSIDEWLVRSSEVHSCFSRSVYGRVKIAGRGFDPSPE